MIVVSWLADHNQILLTRSVGGPSLHNDNRGIKITVNFTPIPPSLEAGKKCQANAKAAVVTKISYFHEDIELNVSLVKVIALLKHLLELSHLFNHEACNINSSTEGEDPVQLNGLADFKQMWLEATLQKSPELKLSIVEHHVHNLLV